MKKRCAWVPKNNLLYEKYHDEEWGVPVCDDTVLFEFLVLESAQAGLSWEIILRKRLGYKRTFANFDVKKIASFTARDESQLLKNTEIIRNRLKIKSTINNANCFIKVQKNFGTFSNYIWGFVENRPIQNKWRYVKDIPATTPIAEMLSKDLKKRGFKFLGPTICYAYMQAVGLVNDHTIDCYRYKEVRKKT